MSCTRCAVFFVFVLACSATPAPRETRTPVETPKPTPALTLTQRHKAAYADAVALATRGDFAGASRLLAPFEKETEPLTSEKLAYWIHNEQTWLVWARGDLAGALGETMQGAAALDKSTQDKDAVESMRLHALWDRAYLLLDLNDPRADAARADYEALAKPRNDHDGMAVLEAFFMAKRNKGPEAIAAAKRVDVEKDDDLQDLYVIALAFDAGGDHESARAVRRRICAGNDYLMKPIILARLAAEGFRC
jgi:ATP/maltotriose-dependent transcriptional regulator MalT